MHCLAVKWDRVKCSRHAGNGREWTRNSCQSSERAVNRETVLLRLNSINYTRKKCCWIIKPGRHEKNINTHTCLVTRLGVHSPLLIPWSLISFNCSLLQFIVLITAESIQPGTSDGKFPRSFKFMSRIHLVTSLCKVFGKGEKKTGLDWTGLSGWHI